MPNDWYRRETWTEQDREEFRARLGRSRGAWNKAQYASIQALTLAETGSRANAVAALELLDLVMENWPEPFLMSGVRQSRAHCFEVIGDLPRAVEEYRLSLQHQRSFPNVRTQAYLDFAWLVATTPLPDHYHEAIAVLDEFSEEIFPIHRYRSDASRALILEALGLRDRARNYALRALESAAATHSGISGHAKLGLVKSPDEAVQSRLLRLARA